MSRSLRIWLLGSCALAVGCSDDDSRSYGLITTEDAGAGGLVTPVADAGAGPAGCSGQDALSQLLCQFGVQGFGPDAGAQAGQPSVNDLLTSLNGLAGLFGVGTGTGTGTGTGNTGGFGGLFGGGTGGLPGAMQPGSPGCANATDPFSQLVCGFGRDGGFPFPWGRDGGLTPPPVFDAAAPLEDAGVPSEDAGADAGDGSIEDASALVEDASPLELDAGP